MTKQKEKIQYLIGDYELSCNLIVEAFAKKQGLTFDGWVGDDIGVMASFDDEYFFPMENMVHDLKTGQPKGLITKWQDHAVEKHLKTGKSINYKSYSKGLR